MKPPKPTRPVAKADHGDIVYLAILIAERDRKATSYRAQVARETDPAMKERGEQEASRIDDDICQLCVRMKRLCGGDKSALEG